MNHNPVPLLAEMPLQEVEQRAKELVLHGRVNHAYRRLQEYQASRTTWGARHAGVFWARPVAYFSAEFGMHESLPIYSGGLGVLAGDHLKSASDLGIPLVGIGLFYRQGYFRQRLDMNGGQHEEYITNDPAQLPLELAVDGTGAAGARGDRDAQRLDSRPDLEARWSAATRCCCSIPTSKAIRRRIAMLTARLYGGDQRVRIRQELLLGVGGVRALRALEDRAGRVASERRPQRLRDARGSPASHASRRNRFRGGQPRA